MPVYRMNMIDTGAGYDVQIDAGISADLLVRSSQSGAWMTALSDFGSSISITPFYTDARFGYGGVQQLSGGGFVVFGTEHSGLGMGVRIQTFDASGAPVSVQFTPMDELDGNALAGNAYSVTPTAGGGFALTWTTTADYSDPVAVDGNGASHSDSYHYGDVRVRYFDAAGNALAPSDVASTDTSLVNGATTNRVYGEQSIRDSDTLSGGGVAYVYIDTIAVGQNAGGFHNQSVITVQVSNGSGSPGTPVQVDVNGLYTGNDGGFSGFNTVDGAAGPNVVALPGGGFAVIWTENSYVADAGVWGGKRFDGWDTKVRYFDAAGQPTSGAIEIVHRDSAMGNINKYVFAEALPDGRIALAFLDGIYGVNGNGQADAYLGIIAANGASTEISRINSVAATNGQSYSLYDLAVRSDGTIDVVYNDAHLGTNGFNTNHTVIERFSVGLGFNGQVLGGGTGNDTFTGGAGRDLVTGGDGNDTLGGGDGNDRIEGGNGNDSLSGGLGIDVLAGGEGNDLLNGDAGADVLVGNNGNDTASYAASAAAVRVDLLAHTASGGFANSDTLESIENLIGSAHADTLTGDDGANVLAGLGGNDVLNGGNGIDTADYSAAASAVRVSLSLVGVQDTVGAGRDTLSNLENLTGSAFSDTLLGNAQSNAIVGGAGGDVLNGLGGSDTMSGGLGNDTYFVDNYSDTTVENAGAGTDTVKTGLFWTLAVNVENLILTGTGGWSGTGNALANDITGNSGANTLTGLAGQDVLRGAGGADLLIGGLEADVLLGGAGNDTFRFDVLEIAANRDVLRDFHHAADRIEISRSAFAAFAGDPAGVLAATSFRVGTVAATADQHLIYNPNNGALYYDADGAGGTAQVQIAILLGAPAITAADIFLI